MTEGETNIMMTLQSALNSFGSLLYRVIHALSCGGGYSLKASSNSMILWIGLDLFLSTSFPMYTHSALKHMINHLERPHILECAKSILPTIQIYIIFCKLNPLLSIWMTYLTMQLLLYCTQDEFTILTLACMVRCIGLYLLLW